MTTRCVTCGIEGVPVYRSTPKGPGITPNWMCEKCLKKYRGVWPDSDVRRIVNILDGGMVE